VAEHKEGTEVAEHKEGTEVAEHKEGTEVAEHKEGTEVAEHKEGTEVAEHKDNVKVAGQEESSDSRDYSLLLMMPIVRPLASEILSQPESAGSIRPIWDYENGRIGPDNWYKLRPEWGVARTGKRQSPINITTMDAVNGMVMKSPLPVQLYYRASMVKVINNGHTIQATFSEESKNTITLGGELLPDGSWRGGERYRLTQFHFHHRSEHKIDNVDYPMEVHLVHAQVANPNKLAVIGVMIEEGAENVHMKRFWEHLPKRPVDHDDREKMKSQEHKQDYEFDPKTLIPLGGDYFQYQGSLTTPPCTENVLWTVMQKPITFSKGQIRTFSALFPKNNRNVQKAFDRLILRYSRPGN
jgi:carbonic anhydrase